MNSRKVRRRLSPAVKKSISSLRRRRTVKAIQHSGILAIPGDAWDDHTAHDRPKDGYKYSGVNFSKVTESIPAGIALSSLREARFIGVNGEFEKISGYGREELIGRSALDLGLWVDMEQREQVVKLLMDKQNVKDLEISARNKRGELLTIRYDAQLIDIRGDAYVLSAIEDMTARKRAESRTKDALAERDAVLRELAHRTRNNMQFIISLLDLQASSSINQALAADFSKAKSRIQSMALVQSRLYDVNDYSHVPFTEFINDLIQELVYAYRVPAGRISFVVRTEAVMLPIDIAMPCGLVLNELLTNSIVHAFPEESKGTITVGFRRLEEGEIELSVCDDGTGVRPGFDAGKDNYSGIRLLRTLVENQLGGTVQFDVSRGLACNIVIKDTSPVQRIS